jgi:hypothetical protein
MKHLFLSLIVVIVFLTSCSKQQQGWTKWRGPNGDGVSTETAWDASKLDSANVLWKKNIGFGHSAIAVQGENCFVTGWHQEVSGKDTFGEDAVYCLNATTGKAIWKFTYPSDDRSFPDPRSTPVIDGKNIYTLSWQGKLFCINAKTGKQKWMVNLIADSLALDDRWGICPSPVIFNDLILLNLNKSGLAISKKTGKMVWNSELKNAHYSTVKIIQFQNKTAGVFMCDSMMNIIDPASGKVLASYHKDSEIGMENDAMVTADGSLFTSDELINIEGPALKSVWKNDTISSFFRVGAVFGGHVYQFSDNKNKAPLVCVDIRNGVPAWSADLGKFGAITVVGDKLMILTGLGKVIIADAKPDGFNIIKELQVLPAEDIEKNWCWTAPTFFGGKLFVRNSAGEMACINLDENMQ